MNKLKNKCKHLIAWKDVRCMNLFRRNWSRNTIQHSLVKENSEEHKWTTRATITMLWVGTDDHYKAKFASPILLFKLSSALFIWIKTSK